MQDGEPLAPRPVSTRSITALQPHSAHPGLGHTPTLTIAMPSQSGSDETQDSIGPIANRLRACAALTACAPPWLPIFPAVPSPPGLVDVLRLPL